LRRTALYALSALLFAAVFGFVVAQPDFGADLDKPYEFKRGPDITAQAADIEVEPRFRALADERFAYQVNTNITRRGTSTDGGKTFSAFRRVENWTTDVTLITSEDPLEGRTDLLLRLQFDQISFLIDNGKARYAGYIGPATDVGTASFHEILPGGERSEVNNIPGWVGINARSLERQRGDQARGFSAAAWFSVSDEGRLYNEAYYADFNSGDQRNYPGRLQDPLHLALAIQPEFAPETRLKLGETTTVRRRLPVGLGHGTAVEYDVTYKLERLYGTVSEPTSARLTFSAVPVQREHTTRLHGLEASFSAPDIKDGEVLFDLVKGVAAWTRWGYSLSGRIKEPGRELAGDFEVEVDFTASLRAPAKQPE
jgi:hypothetical protein